MMVKSTSSKKKLKSYSCRRSSLKKNKHGGSVDAPVSTPNTAAADDASFVFHTQVDAPVPRSCIDVKLIQSRSGSKNTHSSYRNASTIPKLYEGDDSSLSSELDRASSMKDVCKALKSFCFYDKTSVRRLVAANLSVFLKIPNIDELNGNFKKEVVENLLLALQKVGFKKWKDDDNKRSEGSIIDLFLVVSLNQAKKMIGSRLLADKLVRVLDRAVKISTTSLGNFALFHLKALTAYIVGRCEATNRDKLKKKLIMIENGTDLNTISSISINGIYQKNRKIYDAYTLEIDTRHLSFLYGTVVDKCEVCLAIVPLQSIDAKVNEEMRSITIKGQQMGIDQVYDEISFFIKKSNFTRMQECLKRVANLITFPTYLRRECAKVIVSSENESVMTCDLSMEINSRRVWNNLEYTQHTAATKFSCEDRSTPINDSSVNSSENNVKQIETSVRSGSLSGNSRDENVVDEHLTSKQNDREISSNMKDTACQQHDSNESSSEVYMLNENACHDRSTSFSIAQNCPLKLSELSSSKQVTPNAIKNEYIGKSRNIEKSSCGTPLFNQVEQFVAKIFLTKLAGCSFHHENNGFDPLTKILTITRSLLRMNENMTDLQYQMSNLKHFTAGRTDGRDLVTKLGENIQSCMTLINQWKTLMKESEEDLMGIVLQQE